MSARFHPVEASERAETGAADAGSVRKTEVASTGAHPDRSGTRFGILVAKRHAQRAVVRNTIRRVLRESARRRAASLDRAASGVPLHVLMRLKAPFPAKGDDRAWQVLKRELRAESDGLLARLERVVRGGRGPERDSRQPGPAEPARGGA
ncbi:ribonuclease P protein component [Burkholderiales bacterium GJ-E10]|nr:ribonuclease P protein component [Burkholderiales bacterium GJ-E10]